MRERLDESERCERRDDGGDSARRSHSRRRIEWGMWLAVHRGLPGVGVDRETNDAPADLIQSFNRLKVALKRSEFDRRIAGLA